MTASQTLPELYEHDPERAADERARWLAVYGAAFALALRSRAWMPRIPSPDQLAEVVTEAEAIADAEASARAAWEAAQVRQLDAPETGDYCDG